MPVSIKLVVNLAHSKAEGESTGQKLAILAEQFLGRRVESIGSLPYDRNVIDAVRRQSPLLQSHCRSPAALAIHRIGLQLWADPTAAQSPTGIDRFFRQILSANLLATVMGTNQ